MDLRIAQRFGGQGNKNRVGRLNQISRLTVIKSLELAQRYSNIQVEHNREIRNRLIYDKGTPVVQCFGGALGFSVSSNGVLGYPLWKNK